MTSHWIVIKGLTKSRLKDYVHSLEFEKRALVLKKQLKDATGTAEVLTNLCSDSRRIKDFSNSIQYGLEAMRIADSIHSNFERLNAAESIALTYSKLGNYEKAYAYQQLFSELTDSVMSEKKNEQIARMQTQYDTEKKIQENVQLTQQNKLKDLEIGRQKMQRYIVIGSALFLMVLAFLLYSRYRVKQREILSAEIIRQQDMRSKAIIETEEKERIRISRDLHDGIGQTLSAAKLNMSALEGSLHLQNEDQRQNMKNAIELMDESIKEVRAVSHNMMPNALLKSGLGTAVREFLNRIGDTDKVKVDLQVVGMNERLESTTETILFRVLQELVANIVKHAKTGYIGIQLIRHEKELVLMIEDRGIGFDLKKLNDAAGMGLRNVQSRIAYLNGTVDFDSQPGKGTTVTIEIPLS
jgi:two-component system NarL family sensor kinase